MIMAKTNPCVFSPDRRYRYLLEHEWGDLFTQTRYVAVIGLNPSTADERQLDPTLRRVRGFAQRFGFFRLKMLNLFAYRSTDPKVLRLVDDPIGPDNDRRLLEVCQGAELILCCWGSHGSYRGRNKAVLHLLSGLPLQCLGKTKEGHPRHPLYLDRQTALHPV
jgi:hypothetical protein